MKTFNKFIFAALFAVAGFGVYEISSIGTSKAAGGTKIANNQLPIGAPMFAKITLDSAQIVNLNTTPVEVVPAPGVGKFIVPISAYMFYNAGSTPYSNATGSTFTFYYNTAETIFGNGGGILLTLPSKCMGESTSQIGIAKLTITAGGTFDSKDTASNLPLLIANDASNLADGNGIVEIAVTYTIVQ